MRFSRFAACQGSLLAPILRPPEVRFRSVHIGRFTQSLGKPYTTKKSRRKNRLLFNFYELLHFRAAWPGQLKGMVFMCPLTGVAPSYQE